jgi:hypothetical protein
LRIKETEGAIAKWRKSFREELEQAKCDEEVLAEDQRTLKGIAFQRVQSSRLGTVS